MFGPHETNLGWARTLSDRHVAYYARRAAGGAGTIVVETASVHDSDWPYERAPLASQCGPGWESVVQACRPHGSLVIAALGHAGSQGSSAYSQQPLIAPSRVPSVNTREVPKSAEAEDLVSIVAGFAAAAGLAVRSGCDGVEINAAQNSLLREFMSGLNNQRGDEWGTDRVLLLAQVLDAVRTSIGDDRVLGLRLSCDELAPWAGITPEMACELAASLAPSVDYLVVAIGSIFAVAETRPDGHTAPGFNLDLAASIRAAVRAAGSTTPVICQGSIVDVGQAEWAVGDGDRCDGVEMTRAQIADASLVAKLASGDADRIRPCILCNQTCRVRDDRNPIITCVVDPSSGHESSEPEPEPEPQPKSARSTSIGRNVLVVGGGPAGLEAARVAAGRGHRVRLVEASETLGGAVRVAAAGSGRARFGLIVDWLEAECRRLGVDIVTGATFDPDLHVDGALAPGAFDAVVVATGGTDAAPEYPIGQGAVVWSAASYLSGVVVLPGTVAVWDPIGGPIAVSVAERLLAEGREVHLVTPDVIVGTQLSRTLDLSPANVRLLRAGAVLHKRRVVSSAGPGFVEIADRFSTSVERLDVVALIDCGHREPDESLYRALEGRPGLTVLRCGDDVAGRTVHEAILEGRRAALAIDGGTWVSDGVPMGPLH